VEVQDFLERRTSSNLSGLSQEPWTTVGFEAINWI
jgi:hypothetical protein